MHKRCRVCNYHFEREQGYFVGAMYINYGVTALIIVAGYFALEWWTAITLNQPACLVGCGRHNSTRGLLPAIKGVVAGL